MEQPPGRALRSLNGASLVEVKVSGFPGGRTQTLGGLQSPHPRASHPAIELVNERRMRYNEAADGPPRLPMTPSLAGSLPRASFAPSLKLNPCPELLLHGATLKTK